MSFEQWMRQVDKLIAAKFWGMTSDDFDDWLWHDEYSSNTTPKDAVDNWLDDKYIY